MIALGHVVREVLVPAPTTIFTIITLMVMVYMVVHMVRVRAARITVYTPLAVRLVEEMYVTLAMRVEETMHTATPCPLCEGTDMHYPWCVLDGLGDAA